MTDARTAYLTRLCQYVRNTSLVPLPVAFFDDDHEPAGPMSRQALTDAGLIVEDGGGVTLTAAGEALL